VGLEVKSLMAALVVLQLTASAVVAQPSRDAQAARVATGDAAWDRGDHVVAFAEYDAVVKADTAFSTRALFRLGNLHAWSNRLDAAIACHRAYVRLEPNDLEGRVALARTFAWASRFSESVATYDQVLARDANYRDASLGKAMTLAWWGRHSEALEIYDLLAAGGDVLEARKGRARVLAWRGDLGLAESEWREITKEHPRDAGAWVGLAQVLRWAGRPFAAEEALERALTLTPTDRDALEQLRWVRVETNPQASVSFTLAEDSEGNQLAATEVRNTFADRDDAQSHDTRFTVWVRSARAGASSLTSEAALSGMARMERQRGEGGWSSRLDIGLVRLPAVSFGERVLMLGALRLTGRPAPRWRVSAGGGREAFDEVRTTIDDQVTFTGGDVDVGYAATERLSLGLAASRGSADGNTTESSRTTALVAARLSMARGFGTALTHREVQWTEPAYGVFFAPQRLSLTEATVTWNKPGDLGLLLGADVGIGAQGVRFESDPMTSRVVPRAVLRGGWRPVPGREISATLVYANVAGAGAITASEYRYAALTIVGRWTF
jgi:tetratricopeptide (TPR) repeat protein